MTHITVCRECGYGFEIDNYAETCPFCGGDHDGTIRSGVPRRVCDSCGKICYDVNNTFRCPFCGGSAYGSA